MNPSTPSPVRVPRCLGCSYALIGLAKGPCPECGRTFDPADPATVTYGDELPATANTVLNPPGWPMTILAVIAASMILWAASPIIGAPMGNVVLAGCFVLLAAGMWVARFCMAVVVVKRYKQPWSRLTGRPWRWLVVPALLVAADVAADAGLARKVRWWIAQPSLTAYAKSMLAQPSATAQRVTVGTYILSNVRCSGGCVYADLDTSQGILSRSYIVYVPANSPDAAHWASSPRSLGHGWYYGRTEW